MLELLYVLLATVTGIDRQVDPGLVAHAERRVVEIQSNFSHWGVPSGWGEVLGWNRNQPEPVSAIVEGWRTSPGHWAILSDPDYTRIGCATDLDSENKYWFVCMVAVPYMDRHETPPAPSVTIPKPITPTAPTTMSDTAIANSTTGEPNSGSTP